MLLDTTLREGEQSFGTYMGLEEKRAVLTHLARIGVEEVELGCAGQEDLPQLITIAKKVAPAVMHTVWCRCVPQEAAGAARLGCTRVHIGIPVSEAHRTLRLNSSRSELRKRLAVTMQAARENGARMLSVGLEDASRADTEDVLAMAMYAQSLGAARIRISDTVGLWTPQTITRLMEQLQQVISIPVGVHCHNDLGMATANSLTALQAGAAFADCSVLGLGERAGIARLEELAAALTVLGMRPYMLTPCKQLCQLVSGVARVPVSRAAPVVGSDIFAVESGIHAHGVQKHPSLFEPFSPELAGHVRHIGLGRKSGRAAVAHKVRELGLRIDDTALAGLVRAVRTLATKQGRPLTDAEYRALCVTAMRSHRPQNRSAAEEVGGHSFFCTQ